MSALRWLWARPWFRFGAAPALALALMVVASSNKARSAVGRALHDPLALLDGRSPGARDVGALFQTKVPYSRTAPVGTGPHQRVLPVARVRPPFAGGLPGFGESPFGVPGSVLGPLGDTLPDFGGGGAPSLIGDTVPPFIGGGAVPTGATPSTSSPDSAVPEPDDWGLLLIGVATAGLQARRRRTARRAAKPIDLAEPTGVAR